MSLSPRPSDCSTAGSDGSVSLPCYRTGRRSPSATFRLAAVSSSRPRRTATAIKVTDAMTGTQVEHEIDFDNGEYIVFNGTAGH